jgi:hypothetical protein
MKSNLKFSTIISIGFVILLATFLAACPGPHDDDEPRNTAPVADAGPDQAVAPDTTVQLDGSGSSHDDGDTLTYRWVLESKPENSEAALDDPSAVKPTFRTDKRGEYIAKLVVDNGTVDSDEDSVKIFAQVTELASSMVLPTAGHRWANSSSLSPRAWSLMRRENL